MSNSAPSAIVLHGMPCIGGLYRSFDSNGETGSFKVGPTFVGLRLSRTEPILLRDRPRLEDVASGYWTLSVKQSSGLVSHYGSNPPSSARTLDVNSGVL